MSDHHVEYLWNTYMHRFVAEGVHYRDLLDLKARIGRFDQWSTIWAQSAAEAEQRADRALQSNFTQTAAVELARASTHYFFAQFLLWDDRDAKAANYGHCARTFRRAADYLDPPLQPVEIPYDGITMPGYLRLPKGVDKPPLVLLLGGLDTTKEEQLIISTLCAQRGLATLSFDGPGQGETFYKRRLSPDFPNALTAVVDFAERLDAIDPDRLGIIGRSLGGFYAPRLAASDPRVKAAVAWGAMYHLKNYATIPDLTKQGFIYVTGATTLEQVRPYFESVNLEGFADKITIPLMIVHGGLDRITPTENATRMEAECRGPRELLLWEDSIHCVHDRSHICRPAMADFMQARL